MLIGGYGTSNQQKFGWAKSFPASMLPVGAVITRSS